MKQQEKLLFRSLCSFQSENFDKVLLDAATPTVLGQLFFNRMQTVAYGTLSNHNLLGKVNREFRNSLGGAYEQSIRKNKSFLGCVMYLNRILMGCGYRYAMLKGAFLCGHYPQGFRTSNDIDLLVLPEDVTGIGNVLVNAGFRQGNIRNGKFVPATRKEIIESKMTRGEIVPYIKRICLPGMQFLEVDINFSLDYKPGDTQLVSEMLERASNRVAGGLEIPTLEEGDFFVHLCCHLYKEATTLPWVEMSRDMTLYKYCDIYMLLNDIDEVATARLFERARELKMEKICAFAVLQTAALLDLKNKYASVLAGKILESDPDFLHKVISPLDKKQYIFTEKNILERFFCENRKQLLEEVSQNGNTPNAAE